MVLHISSQGAGSRLHIVKHEARVSKVPMGHDSAIVRGSPVMYHETGVRSSLAHITRLQCQTLPVISLDDSLKFSRTHHVTVVRSLTWKRKEAKLESEEAFSDKGRL